MLSEISQIKSNTVWFYLYVKSIKQHTEETKQTHRYTGQLVVSRGMERWTKSVKQIKRYRLPAITISKSLGV